MINYVTSSLILSLGAKAPHGQEDKVKVRGSPVSGITMEQGMTLGSNVIDIVHDVDSMTTAAA